MSNLISNSNNTLPSNATNRLFRGLASTALGQFISAAQSIFLVSLFLKAWGAEGYGKWLTLTALVAYLTFVDLGGQSFIGNLLAMEYVRGNEKKFRDRLSEGLSLFTFIVLSVFCLLCIVLSIPELSIPGHSMPLNLSERLILFFMGASFLVSIPAGVYVTTYRAVGFFARGTMVGNILRLFFLGVYIAVLIMRVAPMTYAAVYLATGIIGTLIIVYDIHCQIPLTRRIKLSFKAAWVGRMHLSGSLYFWLFAVANGLKSQGVIIVLAAAASPIFVAIYATHRTMSGVIRYVSSLIEAPLWPELTFLYAQGRKDDLFRGILLVVKLSVFLSGSAAILLWLFGPFLYPIWTGRELQLYPLLFVILIFQVLLFSGWNSCGWPLLASNQHRELAYAAMANAVVTITLAVIFVSRFGIIGVAAAALIGDVICGLIVFPCLASYKFRFPVRKMYEAIFRPLIILAPLGLGLFVVNNFFHGILRLIVIAVVLLISAYPVAHLALGRREDIEWLWKKLQALRRG